MKLTRRHLLALTAISILLVATGCSDRDPAGLDTARARIDPLVFDDAYSDDVYFQAFSNTHVTAVTTDSVYAYNGSAVDGARSLKIAIPPSGSSLGTYSGGVLTSSANRDLADYNALTFYARSDAPISLDVVGFGNDNTGASLYSAAVGPVALLTNDWTFVVVPIPSPGKIIAERGLFTFAEGLEDPYTDGYNIWIDEIRFAKLDNITNPRPHMATIDKQYFTGSEAQLDSIYTTFDLDGADIDVGHLPGYYDFKSSNSAVATVKGNAIRVVGEGNATITATLDGVDVDGTATLIGYLPPSVPAPQPTVPAADVISMFSGAYQNVPVDVWNAHWQWSTAWDEDYVVDGDVTKMYSSLNFVGIDFAAHLIDASEMTHFHLDVYAPTGTNFKVKIISATGSTEDMVLDASSTPAFTAGSWSSLEIPLANFSLGAYVDWEKITKLALSTDDAQLVLVDNIYWHR